MDKDKGENTHPQKCFQEPGLEAGYSNYTRCWVIYILGRCVFLLTYLVALVITGIFFFQFLSSEKKRYWIIQWLDGGKHILFYSRQEFIFHPQVMPPSFGFEETNNLIVIFLIKKPCSKVLRL